MPATPPPATCSPRTPKRPGEACTPQLSPLSSFRFIFPVIPTALPTIFPLSSFSLSFSAPLRLCVNLLRIVSRFLTPPHIVRPNSTARALGRSRTKWSTLRNPLPSVPSVSSCKNNSVFPHPALRDLRIAPRVLHVTTPAAPPPIAWAQPISPKTQSLKNPSQPFAPFCDLCSSLRPVFICVHQRNLRLPPPLPPVHPANASNGLFTPSPGFCIT